MENKQKKLQSVSKIELTLFLDNLPGESEIGFTDDIQKIRFNWDSIESGYGYELPFETLDSKGNLGAFYVESYLCVMALSDLETTGKMLLIPSDLIPQMEFVLQDFLSKPILNKVLKGWKNVPRNGMVTNVRFSSRAPMLIR